MTRVQIETVEELFRQFEMKDSKDKYIYYLHALIARSVFTTYQEEKSFSNYAEAWESPIAFAMREYLPQNDITLQLVTAIAEQINETTGLDFIQEIVPDLFPGDAESVFEYLEEDRWEKSDRTLFYLLLKIWAVIQAQEKQIAGSYPVSSNQLKAEDTSALLFAEYESWKVDYPKYAEIRAFGKDEFFKTWCLVYGSPFAPVPVTVKRKLSKLLELLLQKGCQEEIILAYYFMARTGKRFKVKEIGSLWDYFQAVFSDKTTAQDKENIRSLGELFYKEKAIFEQCMDEWRNITPKDFLRTLYYLGQKNASRIIEWENCVAYAKLRQVLQRSSGAMIVDANPDFIFRCMEEKSFAEKDLLFVLPSKGLAQIYESEFGGKANFACVTIENPSKKKPGRKIKTESIQSEGSVEKSQEIDFSLIKTDPAHKGREKIFLEEKVETKYEVGIIFARQRSLWMLPSILKALPKLLFENGLLLFQTPQALLNESRYGVRGSLPQDKCSEIILLPNNHESGWLKKQLLMTFSFIQKAVINPKIRIRKSFGIQFEEKRLEKDARIREFICQEPWHIEIPRHEVFAGKKTINRLWEEYRPRLQQGKARETKCYNYSEEIKIWYSLSKGRGRFSIYEPPTKVQEKRNPLERGKKVIGPILFRAKSVSAAKEKLRDRIFREPLKSVIQKMIFNSYREKPITLRSFFFCQQDRLQENQSYRKSVMEELLSAPSFGEISSADTVALEEYQAKMEKEFGDRGKGEKLLLWRQLNFLLREGERWEPKRFYPNPISSYVNSLVEKDVDRQRMRESLAKRFFGLREEDIIWDGITKGLSKNRVLLGCAISFYTGMSNSEICALDWGDFQSISGKTGKQFLVYKRVTAKGEIKHLGTESRGTYRRIPLVSSLCPLLEQQKERVTKGLSASWGRAVLDKELDALPIVTENAADFEKRCSPSRLKKAKDELQQTAGILPLEGSLGGDQSQKSTDFNDYQGDLFRANFRQRALQTCLMSEAELNYLLGISMPNTFSKHYCDYINDLSQLLMAQKLERWAVLHPRREPEVSFENPLTGGRQTLRLQTGRYNQRVCVDLEIKAELLPEENKGQFLLDIKDDCGVDVEFYTITKKGTKE